jgi:hypothetical protein
MSKAIPLHRRGKIFYFFWRNDQGKRVEESLRTENREQQVKTVTRLVELLDFVQDRPRRHWVRDFPENLKKRKTSGKLTSSGNLKRGSLSCFLIWNS